MDHNFVSSGYVYYLHMKVFFGEGLPNLKEEPDNVYQLVG